MQFCEASATRRAERVRDMTCLDCILPSPERSSDYAEARPYRVHAVAHRLRRRRCNPNDTNARSSSPARACPRAGAGCVGALFGHTDASGAAGERQLPDVVQLRCADDRHAAARDGDARRLLRVELAVRAGLIRHCWKRSGWRCDDDPHEWTATAARTVSGWERHRLRRDLHHDRHARVVGEIDHESSMRRSR